MPYAVEKSRMKGIKEAENRIKGKKKAHLSLTQFDKHALMRIVGVEPTHLAVYAPETHASAYSATSAQMQKLL